MRKLLFVLLCLLFSVSLCAFTACGGKNNSNGIVSIEKTATDGLVDTYTITFTNGTTTTFTVTNGKDAEYVATDADYLDYYLLSDGTLGVKVGNSIYLEEIVIPAEYKGKKITRILDNGFRVTTETSLDSNLINPYLKSIVIPDTVEVIGSGAFYNCIRLENITIPDSVISIGIQAFLGCSNLTTVTMGESVESIGEQAFYGCRNLKNITIPNSVTAIGSSAFRDCSSLESITIPDSVNSVGSSAFYNCNMLTDVIIGNGVTAISQGMFGDCSNLTNVTIGNKVATIGDHAFCYCYRLESVVIPNSVTHIGQSAFWECGLKDITIPNSVTSIGAGAFFGCERLVEMTLPFVGASREEVVGYTALGYIFADHVPSSLKEITITDSTIIPHNAFYGCSGLTKITIPSTVTSIGHHAFYGCKSLESITIPHSVTSIDNWAFYDCSSLESIIFEDPSIWYCTNDYNGWLNKTGGDVIALDEPSVNITYFTSSDYYYNCYYNWYWYKV